MITESFHVFNLYIQLFQSDSSNKLYCLQFISKKYHTFSPETLYESRKVFETELLILAFITIAYNHCILTASNHSAALVL